MQHREQPIEGATGGEATVPTRTGDDVPTSVITPTEAKTMGIVVLRRSPSAASPCSSR